MLEIADLKVTRGDFHASLAHLHVASGQCAALCGVSGSGKSTLLEGIGLLTTSLSFSSFVLDGLNLHGLSEDERQLVRIRYLGIMPQSGGMLPFLTVEENLILQMKLAWRTALAPSLQCPDGGAEEGACCSEASLARRLKERFAELQDLCASLQLADQLQKRPSQLSVGQRQRALFVRALAHKPRLLLIDEPTSALDPENAATLFELIEKTTVQSQISTLIVTHDVDSVQDYKHYVFDSQQSHAGYSVFH